MDITQELLQNKRTKLQSAQTQLKNEFVGIDAVIDHVMDNLSSWYLFPWMQERPVIVNLWGLTGVGKSSLVNRLMQLLEVDKKYFRFDLGENFDREYSIKKKLASVFPEFNGQPMVLAFDEFQHARTIDQLGAEIDKGFIRTIWEILDCGKFTMNYSGRYQSNLAQLISALTFALQQGVIVQNGKVVEQQRFFYDLFHTRGTGIGMHRNYIGLDEKISEEDLDFVNSRFTDELFELSLGRFKDEIQLRHFIDSLDGPQTLKLLKEILENSLAPQVVDCTRAIVFIMGNLDEAYGMSKDLNPDISADIFHQLSLKINISSVKKALSKRFRQEQIARLGNCHIIYSSLNSATFRTIIGKELARLETDARSLNIDLRFEESVNTLIYSEGVFPTQGIRPIFTTIHQLIGSKLGSIISDHIIDNTAAAIKISCQGANLKIQYSHNDCVVNERVIPMTLSLGKLRASRKDDRQAVTAVHEAGHAILAMALLRVLPKAVYSVTAEEGADGFVYTDANWSCIVRHEITRRIAVLMGGIAAEEVIFGKDYITSGAESDLQKATRFVNQMVLESGMGEQVGSYTYSRGNIPFHLLAKDKHLTYSEKLLSDGHALAIETLNKERGWLIHLADYLSDNTFAGEDILKQIALLYAEDFKLDQLNNRSTGNNYRNKLKELMDQYSIELLDVEDGVETTIKVLPAA